MAHVKYQVSAIHRLKFVSQILEASKCGRTLAFCLSIFASINEKDTASRREGTVKAFLGKQEARHRKGPGKEEGRI